MLHLSAAADQPSVHDAAFVELAWSPNRAPSTSRPSTTAFARPGPDALAVLSRAAPATRPRSAWSRPSPPPTPSPSTSRRPWRPSTGSAAARRAGGSRRVHFYRGRGLASSAAATPPPPTRCAQGRPDGVADAAAQAAGQLGGRRRRYGRGHQRPLHRPGQAPPRRLPPAPPSRVKGPRFVPRPPQGHPVRVVDATDGQARDSRAARHADVALVRCVPRPQTLGRCRGPNCSDVRREARPRPRRICGSFASSSTSTPATRSTRGRAPATEEAAPATTRRPAVPRRPSCTSPNLIASWHREGTVDGSPPPRPPSHQPRPGAPRQSHGGAAPAPRTRSGTFYSAASLRDHLGPGPGSSQPIRRRAGEASRTVRPLKQMRTGGPLPGRAHQPPPSGPTRGFAVRRSTSASCEHLARTAERGLFDFFFLAEGLRLREHKGQVHDLDVVGRARVAHRAERRLAAVTGHRGLAATVNATFNEPYELARRLATLDHLSRRPGRLERGDHLRRPHRRELPTRRLPSTHADRARPGLAEFAATARELWDSSGRRRLLTRPFAHRGRHFGHHGRVHRAAAPPRRGILAGHPGRATSTRDGVRRRHGRRDLHPPRPRSRTAAPSTPM